jgi:hypothetical protein
MATLKQHSVDEALCYVLNMEEKCNRSKGKMRNRKRLQRYRK